MKASTIAFGLLRIPVDFTMVVLAFLLGYKLRLMGDFIPGVHFPIEAQDLLAPNEYFSLALLFACMYVVVSVFFRRYRFSNPPGPLREMREVFSTAVVWGLVVMSYFFVVREVAFSRLTLGFSLILSTVLVMLARLVLTWVKHLLLNADIGKRRVLLIGSNKITKGLAKQLEKDPHYTVVGYISATNEKVPGLKRRGSLKDLARVVRRHQVEELIQTSQDLSHMEDHEILEFCRHKHLEYRFVPDILAMERSNIEVEPLAGFPLIHLKPTPLDGWGRVYKRSMDMLLSGLGLLALSPLFLAVAIAIKLDSKGPVFFCRLSDGSPAARVGQHGKHFQFFKFRSMRHNSHKERKQLAEKSHRKGPLMKIKNDPRITKVGRLLRRTSIDELPNLWNVLKGDMSLVGPRPHLPEEVADYEDHHQFVLTIKPGITGLSQINGRSDLDFEEEVRLDTYYIKHWSPFLDFKILLKTIMVVISGKAAD